MGTDGTQLDEQAALAAALAVVTAANDWSPDWAARRSAITGAEAGNPWGDDDLGNQLRDSYLPASAQLMPQGDQVGPNWSTLSEGARDGVFNVVDTDGVNARAFSGSGGGVTAPQGLDPVEITGSRPTPTHGAHH